MFKAQQNLVKRRKENWLSPSLGGTGWQVEMAKALRLRGGWGEANSHTRLPIVAATRGWDHHLIPLCNSGHSGHHWALALLVLCHFRASEMKRPFQVG